MGENLYYLMKKAQHGDKEALQQLIVTFEPKIKKVVSDLTIKNKEDLMQDIKLKLIEKIQEYDLERLPGFWGFLEEDNQCQESRKKKIKFHFK